MLAQVLMLALASPAEAYSLKTNTEGDALRWLKIPVAYHINPTNRSGLDETEVESLIHGAFDQWQAVTKVPLSFDYQGETDVSEPSYTDNANVVYFEDSWPADWDSGRRKRGARADR